MTLLMVVRPRLLALCQRCRMKGMSVSRVQGLASADFVIEAVRESEDIKRSVFMRLDQVT